MSGPAISDHALVRFLDRAGGVDVEALRAGITRSLARGHAAARSVSASDYLLTIDGLVFVVRGETVTTVMDEGRPDQKFRAICAPGGNGKA